MGNHTLVRTDHLDQSMATQIEGNINAVSTTQLQKLAPTGRSITSIRNELERGESTLVSESPQTSLFVETEDGLELNTDHAITLAQQFDAAVVMAYNIGRSGFKNSSAAKLINDPAAKTKYNDLKAAWRAFSKVIKTDKDGQIVYAQKTGKPVKITLTGLLNRRNCELNIYYKGIYKRW